MPLESFSLPPAEFPHPQTVTQRALEDFHRRQPDNFEGEDYSPTGKKLQDQINSIAWSRDYLPVGQLSDGIALLVELELKDKASPHPYLQFPPSVGGTKAIQVVTDLTGLSPEEAGIQRSGDGHHIIENPLPLLLLIRNEIDSRAASQVQDRRPPTVHEHDKQFPSSRSLIDESDYKDDIRQWLIQWARENADGIQKNVLYDEELQAYGKTEQALETQHLLLRAMDVYLQQHPETEESVKSSTRSEYVQFKRFIVSEVLNSIKPRSAQERKRLEDVRQWWQEAAERRPE